MPPRIIYYYQTFDPGLYNLFNTSNVVTHIHLASIHFGNDGNGNPYIHLNDNDPRDKIFDHVWEDLKIIKQYNTKTVLMVGGAGGGFNAFFSNYTNNLNLLIELIKQKRDIIDGVDLDVEESVDINNIIKLICTLKSTFGQGFIISMAPVQSSLESDGPCMGSFSYKDLYKKVGSMIDYFNCQFYYDYSLSAFDNVISNGYPVDKIVVGSISSQDFNNCIKTVKEISIKYKKFGGVYNWEYFDSPPSIYNPALWSICMSNELNKVR